MLTSVSMSPFPADDVPPYFKTEPVRTQVHLEGNRLVLTCMAEGSWPLEFKWLHNNRELTKFSLEYRQARCLFLPSRPPGSCRAQRGPRVVGRGPCGSLEELLGGWVAEVGGQGGPAPG